MNTTFGKAVAAVPDVLVADRDRDRARGTLTAAFTTGRLTEPEYEVRVGQALHARRQSELCAALEGLPVVAGQSKASDTKAASRRRSSLRRSPKSYPQAGISNTLELLALLIILGVLITTALSIF